MERVALSPGSPIFSMHARKEGEPEDKVTLSHIFPASEKKKKKKKNWEGPGDEAMERAQDCVMTRFDLCYSVKGRQDSAVYINLPMVP